MSIITANHRMPPPEDLARELLALVNQAGREGWTDATFKPIYQRYFLRFRDSLNRQVRRPEVAQELAQEVMMNIFKAPGQFESLSAFEAWMTTISQNVLKNYWRSLGAQKRQGAEFPVDELEGAGHRGEQPAAASPASRPFLDPLQEILRTERKVRVAKALEQLPPKMRNVAVLWFKQERSYEEIARILGVSINTVKSQLHAAKKRLTELLGDDERE